ncbi:MAG TPA: hypothetical protein VJV03_09955 [Pyrinomonadaceae bacterium]|nr:hypothetical protein [Pyrinomonadaceae bacterium]
MSAPTLEQVEDLARQLSPAERKSLINLLFSLPDSDIATATIDPPSPLLSPSDENKVKEFANTDALVILSSDTYAAVFLRGRAMFQVYFFKENFKQSRMEIQSWKDAEPSEKIKNELREILKLYGRTEIGDEELIQLCRRPHLELFEAETIRISNEFSARLPHMVKLLYQAGMEIVYLGFHNDFAERTGQRKRTLEEMVKALEPFWREIKTHLSLTPGGRRNVKHDWSMRDYICLDVHYNRLKPIWREAKRTAKEAQSAREPGRRRRWKEEVEAIYKEENLPDDLLNQLELPQSVPPSELALTHAGRICIPDAAYSTRVLKEKLLHLKRPTRT